MFIYNICSRQTSRETSPEQQQEQISREERDKSNRTGSNWTMRNVLNERHRMLMPDRESMVSDNLKGFCFVRYKLNKESKQMSQPWWLNGYCA